MIDPVITKEGITYEKTAIIKWINKNGTCPTTRNPLRINDLIPNISLHLCTFKMPSSKYVKDILLIYVFYWIFF
jgi:hypothetical protein